MSKSRIRFVDKAAQEDVVLMTFRHPAPGFAVLSSGHVDAEAAADANDTLDVTVVAPQEAKHGLAEWTAGMGSADGTQPVYIKYRGVELLWRPGRAVLLCDPDQVEALLAGLAEFAQYERELRRIEAEIAQSWPEVEEDNTLAFDVTAADLERSEIVGGRMQRTLRRRIRFARIEPYLDAVDADAGAPAAGRKLGEELRERTGVGARAEIVDGQLEVYEHIYEMSSQRMGEYKAARQGHIMELVIIWLLIAEALLMALQVILRLH